jgi:hypothetical protein
VKAGETLKSEVKPDRKTSAGIHSDAFSAIVVSISGGFYRGVLAARLVGKRIAGNQSLAGVLKPARNATLLLMQKGGSLECICWRVVQAPLQAISGKRVEC